MLKKNAPYSPIVSACAGGYIPHKTSDAMSLRLQLALMRMAKPDPGTLHASVSTNFQIRGIGEWPLSEVPPKRFSLFKRLCNVWHWHCS
jgi:hypothetical protein